MSNEDKEFMKTRIKDSAFTSFQLCNYNNEINLTKNEQLALNNSSNNKNIVIVLLDKDKYLERMSKILNNNAKFELLQFDQDKELNFVLNLERKNINVLKLQRLITTICTLAAFFLAYYMVWLRCMSQ